jgi:hypothetical protein
MPAEVPFPDPLGVLEAEARAAGAPVVPADPLLLACRRWLGRFVEQRERAIQNYAAALQAQPLDPEARFRAIENYARSLMRFGR